MDGINFQNKKMRYEILKILQQKYKISRVQSYMETFKTKMSLRK